MTHEFDASSEIVGDSLTDSFFDNLTESATISDKSRKPSTKDETCWMSAFETPKLSKSAIKKDRAIAEPAPMRLDATIMSPSLFSQGQKLEASTPTVKSVRTSIS